MVQGLLGPGSKSDIALDVSDLILFSEKKNPFYYYQHTS